MALIKVRKVLERYPDLLDEIKAAWTRAAEGV